LRYAEREFLKTLREIGEFGLIPQIREWMTVKDPSLIKTIGEDVAVIDMGREALLITTDILIEDIHFERSWTDPYRLGKKVEHPSHMHWKTPPSKGWVLRD
jgi:hypothetical protein